MSHYSLPILILNLGGEMFYVLEQRLKAQKIPSERAQKVLNEIAAMMLNERFIAEIFKPQQLYNKEELFLLFREIAHASIMKLNDLSMGKLYDLMIMVFKYQLYCANEPNDILLMTLNHLDSLRIMVSSPDIYKQLDSVYCLLVKTYYSMRKAAFQRIRYDLLNYFQDIHIKVSIFLRLGLQNNDGTFINPIENVPNGSEVPGVIKIFNEDGSINDFITFPPGGEYVVVNKKGSLNFKGNRGTELGTSVYQEKSVSQDFSWSCSESSLESQIVQSAKEYVYRSEMNTLMTQLLGKKYKGNENETILLDLFTSGEMERTTEDKFEIETVTLSDSLNQENPVLKTIASEMNVILEHSKENDVLYLLENTE